MSAFDEQEMAHAMTVLEQVRPNWLLRPGVTAVDLGFKWSEGAMTGRLAIRVHVAQKKPLAELSETDMFPKEVEGVLVDVIEAQYGVQQIHPGEEAQLESAQPGRNRRFDEIPAGVSIGSPNVSAGTLGAKVVDEATGTEMILSNWHILVGDPDAEIGLPTWQPGRLDGGNGGDAFATLTRWVLGPFDAAVATVDGSRGVLAETFEGRRLAAAGQPQLGMRVWKSGRTTGLTEGMIDGIRMSVPLNYGRAGTVVIREVFRIVPLPGAGNIEVSLGGDSGSVWATEEGLAVGLHFAGETGNSPEHALANELPPVLSRLQVRLASESAPPDPGPVIPDPGDSEPPISGPVDEEPGDTPPPIQAPPPLTWWQRFVLFWRRLFGLD